MTTEMITIRGQAYKVAHEEVTGDPNSNLIGLQKLMREKKIKRSFALQKPRGQKIFMAYEFENGTFSSVTSMR